ncbi:MAG: tRNA A-37 threonylcarbamoyl transferase component Bud32 [bacterium]|jgi:tRNA A-37 threonylcarbamoyl transferase component Bud32
MTDIPRGGEPKNFAGDRYEVIRVLGTGGTATVYLVRDTSLDVLRALKVLRVGNADLGRRLASEARMMANLDNPHILRVVDVGEDNGRPYIVMEYLSGGTLADIGEEGPLAVKAAVSWMLQVLAALSASHAVGIVHRDVKPSNVLLDANGVASLADFGIAFRDGADEERSTRTGVAMGTLAFMAPEQRLDARSVSRAADTYAVGSSLYSLLTYRSAMDLFVVQEGGKRMRGVPPELEAILLKATRYQAEERYSTAAEMADDLWALLPNASTKPLFAVDSDAVPPFRAHTATPGPLASRIRPAADVTARAMGAMALLDGGGTKPTLIPIAGETLPLWAETRLARHSPWVSWGIGLGATAFVVSLVVLVCLVGDVGGDLGQPSDASLSDRMQADPMDAIADADRGPEPDSDVDSDVDSDTDFDVDSALAVIGPSNPIIRPAPVVASQPSPVLIETGPAPVAGPFPAGQYVGYLDSRPVDLRLTGSSGVLSANITTWFSELDRSNSTDNRQSRTMTGTWDAATDTLMLSDQGEFRGAGTIEAQWTGRSFSGRFRDRRGTHITSFEARPR